MNKQTNKNIKNKQTNKTKQKQNKKQKQKQNIYTLMMFDLQTQNLKNLGKKIKIKTCLLFSIKKSG